MGRIQWTKGWFTSQAARSRWREVSSRCSERHAMKNLWIVYFWNFPFNIFLLRLTAGNWNHGQQDHRWGGEDWTSKYLSETEMLCLKKSKNRTTIQSNTSTRGYLSKENENTNSKRYLHPDGFIAALFTVAKIWKLFKCIDKWMAKENVVHIHNGILLSQKKKNKILPFVGMWMALEGIMLSETSQTEKDKHCMLSLTCGI